jgi:hypothetical protein
MAVKQYKVKSVGLDWEVDGVPRRAEKGEVVDDLPEESISWLLEDELIEEVKPRGQVRKQ